MDITKQAEKAPTLRDLPSRLLGQTAALVGRVAGEALAEAGSHRYAFATLATLDAFGALSQAELCRRTDLDRSDMNATVNALETEGSVTRQPDPMDRRQNIVTLTEAGRARFEDLERRLAAAHDRALSPLSAEERAVLVGLLQRLHDHLAQG
jgi:DNA-binding MarR family transcriptional regulator